MDINKRFKKCYEEMLEICDEAGWGDPFNFSRGKEIYLSILLDHKVSDNLSGADAVDDEGEAEYKSTTSKNIQATYNGISKQDSWEEQVEYLRKDKIGKYKNHYYARFEGSKIKEVWWLGGKDVTQIAIRKLKDRYHNPKNKKDPRLGFTINKREIEENGIRII